MPRSKKPDKQWEDLKPTVERLLEENKALKNEVYILSYLLGCKLEEMNKPTFILRGQYKLEELDQLARYVKKHNPKATILALRHDQELWMLNDEELAMLGLLRSSNFKGH